MKLIASLVLLAAFTLACWWCYHMGETSMELEYTKRITELNLQAENELKSKQVQINEIQYTRATEQFAAQARIKRLENELQSGKAVKSCVQNMSGTVTALIADDVNRVLREATSDQRIPQATDSTGYVDTQTPVTADHLAGYSFYTIEQYNQVAADYNALVEMCN